MSIANAPSSTPTNRLALARAEAWVVHHVVLEHLLDDDPDGDQPWWALEAARKLEAGQRRFTTFEAWRLRCALLEYARNEETPEGDVDRSMTIVDRIEREFDGPPAAIR